MQPDEDLIERVASNVRRLRDLKGLTIREVAEQANLPPRMLQKIEAGGCNLRIETLAKLCVGLEEDIQELVHPPPAPKKKS